MHLNKCADDTKLEGAVDIPNGCTTIQRHLNRLEKQADRTLLKFKKGKCSLEGEQK